MKLKNNISIIIISTMIFANSNGPPGGYANNAPNYRNCTVCHSGNVNSGDGSVAFFDLPTTYQLGERYSIGVIVTGSNSRGYGFQAIAMNENNSAGTITLNESSNNVELNGDYVQQSTTTNSGNWVFDWIAPLTNIGDITFSVSGLATGGSSNNSGDDVYTHAISISYQQLHTKSDFEKKTFQLFSNYPNPFNPYTKIRFRLDKNEFVNITIYDMQGNVVNNLIRGIKYSGYNTITWDATDNRGQAVSAGSYIYSVEIGDLRKTKKMILLK